MRRTLVFLLVFLFITAGAFVAWQFAGPITVDAVQPTRGPAVEAVHATGLVEPSLEIRIAPRAAGRLVELRVDEGDLVKRGQLLARLEDVDLAASVTELEARVEYAKAQYERNLQLQRAKLISQEAVDRTRAELDATRATLKRARDEAGFMRLTAPADGRIIRRDGEIGEFIPINQTVFYMAGPAPLRVTAEIDEEDVPRVRPGQSVLIRSDAFPDRTLEGAVDQLTPRGDPIARSYRVRIGLPAHHDLQIGMTAEANIIVARRDNALLVPATAVSDGQVWVINQGRLEHRAVSVGIVGRDRTEIRDGLAEGDWIVAQPAANLKPGRRVRVQTATARPARP